MRDRFLRDRQFRFYDTVNSVDVLFSTYGGASFANGFYESRHGGTVERVKMLP